MVSGTGNNGDTKGFDTLWGDGTGGLGSDLAYVPGMHFLPANGSHFDATDYIFAGALQKLGTGWLGRWLDQNGSTTNPLQAISIGSSLSKTIRSASAPVCSVPTTFGNFRFAVGNANVNDEVGRLAAIPGTTPGVTAEPLGLLQHGQRLEPAGQHDAARRQPGLPAELAVRPPEDRCHAALGEPRREGRDDRLGLVRHPR